MWLILSSSLIISEIKEQDLVSEILLFFGSNLVQLEGFVHFTREYITSKKGHSDHKHPKITILKAADELSTKPDIILRTKITAYVTGLN